MYYLKDICFLCIKNNRKVQSVLLQDTDGIVFNEKLRCFFPEIIDSTPDKYKLACSECLEKLRISYDFKQSVICNNPVFRDYIDKLHCQHKSSKHEILSLTTDLTATKMENYDEKHISNSMKIQNENLNLTSIKQQLNTRDQSCQLTTNENVAFVTKLSCPPNETNFKTENIDEVYPISEEIYIKEEPFVDGFTSNNLDEESKESADSNSTSSDSENNDQPKQGDGKKGLYTCDECHKVFSTSSILERHRRCHRREKPFQCEKNQPYTEEALYQCHICQFKCSNSYNFKRHIQTHTGEKTYQCSVCSKTFIQSCNLSRHMRTHTGEKPYQCHICQYKCSDPSSLKYHIRSHTGEKPYECSVCNKTFTENSDLTRHIRIHTGEKPYQCLVCSKTFMQNCNLTTHMRTHTGEKPYQCHICEYKCSFSNSLKCHVRTHTGEKTYQCSVCSKTFMQNCNLTRHMRVHTEEKPC